MKRAIVIILIMILVAGGAGGGLIMLGIVPNPFNPKVETPMTAAEKAAADLAAKTKFKPPLAAYVLVKMDDMVVPVIVNGRAERRVLLIARLVGTSAPDEAIIKAGMNRFQDAVLNDLFVYFQTYFDKRDMLDVVDLKARLVKHAKAVFGDRVQDVLLINAFEQGNGRIQ